MKVVINTSVGLFAVSLVGIKRYIELGGEVSADELDLARQRGYGFELGNRYRAEERLIQMVEEFGERANGDVARLKIVEVPDDVEWEVVQDETGIEWVAEKHRTWGLEGETQ